MNEDEDARTWVWVWCWYGRVDGCRSFLIEEDFGYLNSKVRYCMRAG